MKKISNWIWAEIVLLIGLLIAFVVGVFDAKTYATLAIIILVVFAFPAFLKMANKQAPEGDNG